MSMIGKTLGHYKIGDQSLGKGGMGEVYRAKDLKLGRDVAIKVPPEEFARDTDRVAGFLREAKLLASLNHPNIAAIYGLEESGGTNFLVLELVEGETLADQLKRGPIPVEESLKLALQIADALEAAQWCVPNIACRKASNSIIRIFQVSLFPLMAKNSSM
jgi:eukaryotic-like serine/threonine-protein kinase